MCLTDLAIVAPITGIVALVAVGILSWLVKRENAGTKRMREISSFIQEGAYAFLRREFKTIFYFIIILAVLLWIALRWEIALGFVLGSALSLLAAYIGMSIAVRANVRTANAALSSAGKAMTIAFRGGAVTGLSVVGMSLLGLGILFIAFREEPDLLVGFGFGASLAALFAQLGGGIYTKAADVGADLVGKLEEHIPEDDPRNPAVIADQVGDNVGDCAGRGADLFESFSDNIIGAMIVGIVFTSFWPNAIIFPFLLESVGVIATIIGIFLVRGGKSPMKSLYFGFFSTGVICAVGFYGLCIWLMQDISLFFCATLGLLASLIVAVIVAYYTGEGGKVTKEIAKASQSGPALTLITGFSYGLESAVLPVLLIAFVTIASFFIAGGTAGGIHGIYGIATATLGILSTTGIIMASDTFGPISDNAQGISEMAGVKKEMRKASETLDAVGNVTKAVTKGYAMTCCVLTAVLILFAYLTQAARISGIPINLDAIVVNLAHPTVVAAIFIGATIPFIFSALAVRAVGRTSFKMVEEVRRQFREIKGLLEGNAKPDYSTCVDISTRDALREMILPTLIALVSPIAVGFLLNVWALAGYLIAVKVVAGLLAMFMYNSGGAWDNSKKYIEAGNFGGPGTETHAASVIGDTFGDPLKDCAGPSLHILVKLQNILAITLLPLFLKYALVL